MKKVIKGTTSGVQISGNLEQKIDALSEGAKLAIIECANAYRFGGNWGFIKEGSIDFKESLAGLASARPYVRLIQVSNGALILCDEGFLATNVNAIIPNAINYSFVDMARERKAKEKEAFVKFVGKVIAGKSKYVEKKNGYYEISIGVFSVNDTNRIMTNNLEYPAYKLSMLEVIEFSRALTRTGKKVYVKAVSADSATVFLDLDTLQSTPAVIASLYKGLEIADSDTGVFLTLRLS